MQTTVKRIQLALTEEDKHELKVLGEYFGENNSQVIRRALILLNYITFTKNDKDGS